MTRFLRVDASARHSGSTTRDLVDRIMARITDGTEAKITARDLYDGVPQLTETWVAANFTPEGERTDAQREELALSDSLVAELQAADVIVIGVPVYNFGVPASLKAWVDQIARRGVTFRYTESGPEGLLKGKRVILAVASGGTEADSSIDFATPYLRHVLGFLGIDDVQVVRADRQAVDPDATAARAADDIAALNVAA